MHPETHSSDLANERPQHRLSHVQATVLCIEVELAHAVSCAAYDESDEYDLLVAEQDAYIAQHRPILDAIKALQETGALIAPDGNLLRHSIPALEGR